MKHLDRIFITYATESSQNRSIYIKLSKYMNVFPFCGKYVYFQ